MSKRKLDLKREWFEQQADDDDEEFVARDEKKWTEEELWELLQLQNCSQSNAKGMIDAGLPIVYERLAIAGYLLKILGGYHVSNEGKMYLATHKHVLKNK